LKHLNRFWTLPLLAAVFLIGCATVPDSIPDTLSPIEYFQKAQEAAAKQNYEAALLYYNTFIERNPQDAQRIVEAEFEIAFIYYKEKNYAVSLEQFRAILAKYSQPGAELLPAWPRILSDKLIVIIGEKQAPEKAKSGNQGESEPAPAG